MTTPTNGSGYSIQNMTTMYNAVVKNAGAYRDKETSSAGHVHVFGLNCGFSLPGGIGSDKKAAQQAQDAYNQSLQIAQQMIQNIEDAAKKMNDDPLKADT